jgi:Zn-dependent M28 family amino/carboxypeptidase
VVGILPGSDPERAKEYVVIGAHYDHIGVDPWGRIGFGADDNGSGVAALLELADALALARPARSILFCGFSSEEDGLHGSRAIASNPPVPRESLVAMLNLDMIGRGETDEVVVLGVKQNPDLGKVLKRARKLKSTKLKKVITDRADHLWQRSDHYCFHEVGVPSLFLFEAPSDSDNPDYHTFRDTIDRVDLEKVVRTTRFTYNTAWILATDDDRPSAPRER